tara:strand:+ start:710 stop:2320 length:1611 start_codon:yes stop_codon:yes gene_type:complete
MDDFTGNGKYIFKNGDIYNGTFIEGEINGYGSYKKMSGVVLTGKFTSGIINGYGSAEYSNGDIYNGMFDKNIKSGEGEMLYTNGSKFTGIWFNDKKNGKGKLLWDNGNYFIGNFINDEIDEGFYCNSDTTLKFTGTLNQNITGKGKIFYQNGYIFDGKIEQGIPKNGYAEITLKNGIVKGDVTLRDGKYVSGNGKWHSNDGVIIEGAMFERNDREEGVAFYEGIYKETDIDGTIKEYTKRNDSIIGFVKELEKDGSIKEYFIENGKTEGVVKYFKSDGTFSTWHEIRGEIDGEYSQINKNTGLIIKYFFKNGLKNGKSYAYIPDDSNNELFTIMEGNYIENRPNGKFEIEIIENKIVTTKTIIYFSEGSLPYITKLISGEVVATGKLFFGNNPNDSFETLLADMNATMTGEMTSNNSNGKIKLVYEDGNIVKQIKLDKYGNPEPDFKTQIMRDINKTYRCKCCKKTIHGVKDGVSQAGGEFNSWTLDLTINMGEQTYQSAAWSLMGFTTPISFLQNTYKYCNRRCANTCYEENIWD